MTDSPVTSNLESALLEFLRTRKWGDLGDAFRAGWNALDVEINRPKSDEDVRHDIYRRLRLLGYENGEAWDISNGPRPAGETISALHPWVGPSITYPCGCRSPGPNREPPWYCSTHNTSPVATSAPETPAPLRQEPWRLSLPVITPEMFNEHGGQTQLIDMAEGGKLEWTQAAVDFACFLQGLRQSALKASVPLEPPPILMLEGAIEPGQRFIWEPHNGRAWAYIEVTRVQSVRNDETRIWTKCIRGNHPRTEVWNDESRFREACVRTPAENGSLNEVTK